MRKRRIIVLACLLVAVLSVVGWRASLNWWGPWYGGRPLAVWLDQCGSGPGDYKPSPRADEALRHIGTNAVPYLLRLLYATNSSRMTNGLQPTYAFPPMAARNPANVSVKGRLMAWVEKHTPIRFHHTHAPASWDHWKAYLGFQALGPLGKAALPGLVKMAHDPSDNSNPSGTGMAPNVAFWKDTGRVAQFADTSATYLALGQPASRGTVVLTRAILVDGEIAAWSLAAIGAESVPPLMELLADPNPRLRCRAAVALGLMGGAAEPAVPALVKMLGDPDINTRWETTDALGCIGRRADLAIPALMAALSDPNVGMKFTAMGSLGDFGEQATNAIARLLAFFPSGDHRLEETAAAALSKISPDTTAKRVLPLLLRDLENSSPYIRSSAVTTLAQTKVQPEKVIPALIGMADDTNQMVRTSAIFYLGSFGPAARAAVPKLTSLTNDPDSQVRDQALRALQKIEPSH